MNVFTLYSEPHARNLRLWIRSWQQRGYRPQLISVRELDGATIKRVVRRRGGGLFVKPGAFNLGHKRGKPTCKNFGTHGWQRAAVVIFPPEVSEDTLAEFINDAA
jgi:hypothetical protein